MIRSYGPYAPGKVFKVLLLDGIQERNKGFGIKGENWVLVRAELPELSMALGEPWDLLIMSSFFGTHNWEPLMPIGPIVEAFKAKRLRGVMLISPVAIDGMKQFNALRDNNVPVAYYPFDLNNPNCHRRVEL